MKKIFIILTLFLSACTHNPYDVSKSDGALIKKLSIQTEYGIEFSIVYQINNLEYKRPHDVSDKYLVPAGNLKLGVQGRFIDKDKIGFGFLQGGGLLNAVVHAGKAYSLKAKFHDIENKKGKVLLVDDEDQKVVGEIEFFVKPGKIIFVPVFI